MEKLIEFIETDGIFVLIGAFLVLVGRWSKKTPKVEKKVTLEEAFSSTEAIDKITKERILSMVEQTLNDYTLTDREFGEKLGEIRKFWRAAKDLIV